MSNSPSLGTFLVLAGGIAQGAFIAPSKKIRNWAWENYWLLFSMTAYLLVPWSVAYFTIPKLLEIYAGCSFSDFLVIGFFGLTWGLGALTFGLGIEKLGLALGFAVILGTATIVGTLTPYLLTRSATGSSTHLLLTAGGLGIMLAGVAVCSLAGRWKESHNSPGWSYGRGLAICVASGVLSAGGNLGLFFSESMINRAVAMGVAPYLAPNAVWTLLPVPLFLCNSIYAMWLLWKNSTAIHFRQADGARNLWLSVLMGVLWMGGIALYGSGTRQLGQLGTSLGYATFMASTILTSSAIGISTGEWRDAPKEAKRQLVMGILLLVMAIIFLAQLNR